LELILYLFLKNVNRLAVVEGEAELVQLASAQLAHLQRVEGLHGVEAGLVQLAVAQLVRLWLVEGVQGNGGGIYCQLVQL
jgi:hypothetical protein